MLRKNETCLIREFMAGDGEKVPWQIFMVLCTVVEVEVLRSGGPARGVE